jgi:hypothetical protein
MVGDDPIANLRGIAILQSIENYLPLE